MWRPWFEYREEHVLFQSTFCSAQREGAREVLMFMEGEVGCLE